MANCETDGHVYREMSPACIFCGHDPSKSLGGMLGSVVAGYRDGDNKRAADAMVGIVDEVSKLKAALRFIKELSSECLDNGDVRVGTAAEVAMRHIWRKADETL